MMKPRHARPAPARHALFAAALSLLGLQAHADEASAIRYLGQSGSVEIQASGAGVTQHTPFAIASVGKTMTSVALLRLVARGRLTLDDPARDYLPAEIVDGLGGMQGITVRHLLNMTSGLPDYLDDAYAEDAARDPARIQTPEVALTYAFGYPAIFGPGEDFDYSNTNFVLAGLVLERLGGRSYAGMITQEVFEPAGMTRSFVFGSRPLPADFPFGHEDGRHVRDYYGFEGFGDGGVISTAEDVARFYRALFIDKTLLDTAGLAELLRDPVGEGYGLGIDVEGSVLGHAGGDLGFSSDVRIDLRSGTIAVMLVARGDADTDWPDNVIRDR